MEMVMMNRWMLDKPGSKLKNRMINRFGKKLWDPGGFCQKWPRKALRNSGRKDQNLRKILKMDLR